MIYAQHASTEFNARLHADLRVIAADIEKVLGENLLAIVLGGGYGRGEGGVVGQEDEERPYNDLDFTIVVKWKRPFPHAAMHELAERHHERIGIDIDLGRPVTVEDIQVWSPSLRWHDLVHGHVVLKGESDVITRHAPASVEEAPPPIEATRLLLNRGAGLVWAQRIARGCETAPDDDFVRRNYYKCVQAIGDGLLIAYGRYSVDLSERGVRFAALAAEVDEVAALEIEALYRRGLAFKLRPDRAPDLDPVDAALDAMSDLWGRAYLHVERVRTGSDWSSLKEYVDWDGPREAEQNAPSRWLRNGVRNFQVGIWSLEYPRERLYRELPELLELTGQPVEDWSGSSRRFLDIWSTCN